MSSYFLKQPNGRLALFSKVVGNFTFIDMSEAEAREYAEARWGEATAAQMVSDGMADAALNLLWTVTDGLNRWRSALTELAGEHGIDGVRAALVKFGTSEADIPQSALDAALEVARR